MKMGLLQGWGGRQSIRANPPRHLPLAIAVGSMAELEKLMVAPAER
jgi:hypothetical protein